MKKDNCLKGAAGKIELPVSFAWVLPDISIKDNLLMKGNHIIISKFLQAEVLEQVHMGYQGLFIQV